MKSPVPFQWKGIHHLYLGIFFVVFGGFFLYMNNGNGLDGLNYLYGAFIGVGGYLIFDDAVEHTITASTPLRILWDWMSSKL